MPQHKQRQNACQTRMSCSSKRQLTIIGVGGEGRDGSTGVGPRFLRQAPTTVQLTNQLGNLNTNLLLRAEVDERWMTS